MDGINQSPEQLPRAEQPSVLSERGAESGADVIEKLEKRASSLERLKEASQKSTGQHDDDDDQRRAVQAARKSKRSGRYYMVMDREVDLNVVSSRFFSRSVKRVSAIVKRDIQKAVEWLASLREAYQLWEEGPRSGKHLSIALALYMFWKV